MNIIKNFFIAYLFFAPPIILGSGHSTQPTSVASHNKTTILSVADLIKQKKMPAITTEKVIIDGIEHTFATLDLSNKNLTSLNGLAEYKDLYTVEWLNLAQNQLEQLPADLFPLFYSLKILTLSGNLFKKLPENIFDPLTDLQKLYLGGNKLTKLPPLLFKHQTNLKQLYLGGNQLTKLPDYIFFDLRNLDHLALGGNKFRTLTPHMLAGLNNLKTLYLNHNQLHNLPYDVFNHLYSIQIVSLIKNNFTKKEKRHFKHAIERMRHKKAHVQV